MVHDSTIPVSKLPVIVDEYLMLGMARTVTPSFDSHT